MRISGWLSAAALGAFVAGFAGKASAHPEFASPVLGQPASALVYPYFDSTPNMGTLITITNVNKDRHSCGNDFHVGDISVLYTYFGLDTRRDFCREFNIDEFFTPGDTLTVFADQHNPEMELGWLWAEARDPESGEAIDFDYLIGSAIVVDTGTDFLFQYLPYGFRSHIDENAGPEQPPDEDTDACDRFFTDVAEFNGLADFNGEEYDFWPLVLYLDEFFQEGGTNPAFNNRLAIASCDIDPFDDEDTGTVVDVGIFNNREARFSSGFDFECFFLAELNEISLIVRNLRGDPDELVTDGGRSIQAGWIEFLPEDDPILGVFFQRIGTSGFAAGRNLQFDGAFGDIESDPDPNHLPCALPHGACCSNLP